MAAASSMPQHKSFSVDELNHLRQLMTESELKRQLSHDLANDPALATVFNPPQTFSDSSHAQASTTEPISVSSMKAQTENVTNVAVVWAASTPQSQSQPSHQVVSIVFFQSPRIQLWIAVIFGALDCLTVLDYQLGACVRKPERFFCHMPSRAVFLFPLCLLKNCSFFCSQSRTL